MKTDLSNGQLYMDDDNEGSDEDEDEDDDPKHPQWGDVPYQQNYKSFECKLCKTSFKTRNLLFKHLKDVNYHEVTIPNTKKRGAPDAPLVKSSKKWLGSFVYIGAEEYNKVEASAVQAKCITSHNNHRFAKICKFRGSNLEVGLKGFENVVKRTSNGVYRSPRRLADTKHPMNPGVSSIISLWKLHFSAPFIDCETTLMCTC